MTARAAGKKGPAKDAALGLGDDLRATAGGIAEGEIPVNISYDLISQFSHQLYTNPRKAVEELICNSYDAGATVCHVAVPADDGTPLLVLDNGTSMDFDGLKDLWHVARSPKQNRSDGSRHGNGRSQIGKFGVGKLAAFALGRRLTYLAVTGGQVRTISVGEKELLVDRGAGSFKFEVLKADEGAATGAIDKLLPTGFPRPWVEGWRHWTLAIVSEIEDQGQRDAVKVRYLRGMVQRALPLLAGFRVYIDGLEVEPRELRADDIELSVDVLGREFREHLTETLRAFWKERLALAKPTDVPGRYLALRLGKMDNPSNVTGPKLDALLVPELGAVRGGAIITKSSLTTSPLEERGYHDNGFFVRVHGKVVNPEDPLFGITQRSHHYWRRFRATIEVPGLDRAILVQRNQVSEARIETLVVREVLRALFGEAKSLGAAAERAPAYEPPPFGRRLSTLSPFTAGLGFAGLAPEGVAPLPPEDVKIEFRALGSNAGIGYFDPKARLIVLNDDHPAVAAAEEMEGAEGEQLKPFLGEVMAGDLVAGGYLRSQKVDDRVVEETVGLLDDSLRTATGYIRDPVLHHIEQIEAASAEGGKAFEVAIVKAFQDLRIAARRFGAPGESDGVLELSRGTRENFRVSVEAKGSKGIVDHANVDLATCRTHMVEKGCEHAVIVAREFQVEGGKKGEPSVLLRGLGKDVTLLRVDAIKRLLELNRERPFPHDKLESILLSQTPPDKMVSFIEETWRQLPEPGTLRDVMTAIWDAQEQDKINRPNAGMIVADPRVRRRKLSTADVEHIVEFVALATKMLTINVADGTYQLLSRPEAVVAATAKPPKLPKAK